MKSDTRIWLKYAEENYSSAIILMDQGLLNNSIQNFQQAIEKYLKAYLIFQSTTFKFSHDLIYLLDLITQKDSDFESYYDTVSELQGYAVEIRYPNETIFISNEKVEKAMMVAKEIREFVTGKMKITVDYNDIIDT